MSIFERIKEAFSPRIETKATEKVGRIVAPVFKEIPPNTKAGEFLSEGMRSWAYIAISAIADEIACSEMVIQKKRGDKYIEQPNHVVLDLINHPNQFQTREELLWLTVVFLLAEGEAPWLLNRSKNPDDMVLLDPSRLKMIWDDNNIIKEYIYSKKDGKETSLDADLIVFLKLPNYTTPFRGSGIMNYIRQSLDLDNYMEEYLRLFFFNDATPSAVLQTEQKLSDSIVKRLIDQFKQKHGGLKNKHKMAVLEAGLQWKEISSKFGDLQMNAMQESVRDKILSAFRVPKSIVGITKDVNRSNGENEDRVFARRSLQPKMKMIQAQLNQYLLPKFGNNQDLRIEFKNPVQEDLERQAKIDQVYILSGVYTVNEVRERMGLEPIEEEEQEEKEEKEEKEPKEKPKEEPEKAFVDICKDILRDKPKVFTREDKEKFYAKKIQMTDEIEESFKKKLIGYFDRQKKEIIRQAKTVNVNEKREIELMIKLAIPYFGETIRKHSRLVYALLAKEGVILPQDEHADKFIKERALKLGKKATETTRRKVQRVLRDWVKEGADIATLRKRLRATLGSKTRAATIARTEVSRSAGWAQSEVYRKLDIIGKQWVTARDERTCEFCRAMDGVIIPRKKNFWNKGDVMVGDEGGTLKFDFEGVHQFPLHANCVTEDMVVFAPDAQKLTRMKYSGKIIKVTLANGRKFTITPNHPVLTQRGFIAGHLLENGDKLVNILDNERIVFGNPNDKNSPASIGDVFNSFIKSRSVRSMSVPVSAEDFHGDGKGGNGNIDIVSSDSFLWDNREPFFSKPISKSFFNGRDMFGEAFNGFGDFTSMFLALALTADGIVSGEGISKIFTTGSISHHQFIRLKNASNYNARIEKSKSDSAPIDTKAFGEAILRLSRLISFNNIVNIEIDTHNGFVYDVSSMSTVYSVNGVLSSNCRCDLFPVFAEQAIPVNPFGYKKESIIYAKEIALKEKEKEVENKEKKVKTKEQKIGKEKKEIDETLKELEGINGLQKKNK